MITRRKRDIEERFGPWTAGCIHLAGQLYTFDQPHWDSRLRRYLQIAADITGQPLESLRVLDLACLEGQYGVEFALHGADVLATDGREANLAKVRFVKETLALDRLTLLREDVRRLDERHGSFDVVLCLGILYHLDAPDVMEFMQRIATVCRRLTIVDTHVSPTAQASYVWQGRTYSGRYAKEHDAAATAEEKLAAAWSSLDNVRSFHLTRPSLCNLLRHVGFSSVYESLNPYEFHDPRWPQTSDGSEHEVWKDRVTFVAIKGRPQRVRSSPVSEAIEEIDRPEVARYIEDRRAGRAERPSRALARWVGRLPARARRLARKIVG